MVTKIFSILVAFENGSVGNINNGNRNVKAMNIILSITSKTYENVSASLVYVSSHILKTIDGLYLDSYD